MLFALYLQNGPLVYEGICSKPGDISTDDEDSDEDRMPRKTEPDEPASDHGEEFAAQYPKLDSIDSYQCDDLDRLAEPMTKSSLVSLECDRDEVDHRATAAPFDAPYHRSGDECDDYDRPSRTSTADETMEDENDDVDRPARYPLPDLEIGWDEDVPVEPAPADEVHEPIEEDNVASEPGSDVSSFDAGDERDLPSHHMRTDQPSRDTVDRVGKMWMVTHKAGQKSKVRQPLRVDDDMPARIPRPADTEPCYPVPPEGHMPQGHIADTFVPRAENDDDVRIEAIPESPSEDEESGSDEDRPLPQ